MECFKELQNRTLQFVLRTKQFSVW